MYLWVSRKQYKDVPVWHMPSKIRSGILGSMYVRDQVSLIQKDICHSELDISWLIWICSAFRNKMQCYWDGRGFKADLNFLTNNFSPNIPRNKSLVPVQSLALWSSWALPNGLVSISVCVYLEADRNKDVSAGRLSGRKQQWGGGEWDRKGRNDEWKKWRNVDWFLTWEY